MIVEYEGLNATQITPKFDGEGGLTIEYAGGHGALTFTVIAAIDTLFNLGPKEKGVDAFMDVFMPMVRNALKSTNPDLPQDDRTTSDTDDKKDDSLFTPMAELVIGMAARLKALEKLHCQHHPDDGEKLDDEAKDFLLGAVDHGSSKLKAVLMHAMQYGGDK
jgi:hypothetical protein